MDKYRDILTNVENHGDKDEKEKKNMLMML